MNLNPNDNKKTPHGVLRAVQERLGHIRVSRQLISMVRRGIRKNDTVLMAIIETEHYDKHS